MSDADTRPEPDRVDGAPHPRETPRLIGQAQAEAAFLDAFSTGRLHHAWLLMGPQGVGKATLAWSIARFLLATPDLSEDGLFDAPPPPQSLSIDFQHPVARRMAAGAEPGLFVLRRPYDEKAKRLRAQITVDEVRKLKGFFSLSATDGGRRVVIVDAADEMNVSAANALLKLLEEPPARTTLLLVAHQPARLLPTIRSRCRTLRLAPLTADEMAAALAQAGTAVDAPDAAALAELSQGSVGTAVSLVRQDGLRAYADLIALIERLPDLDRPRALKLASAASARGQEARFALTLGLLDTVLARLARTGVTGHPPATQAAAHESTALARLSPGPEAGRAWASLAQSAGDRIRHGHAVNIDPAALLYDLLLQIRDTAQTTRA